MRFINLTRQIEIGANCYYLEIGGKRIVLDSGMHPRRAGEEALPNFAAIEGQNVDVIILTHAHQDHVGTLPVLMRRQPRARVFMSEATRQLADVMLHNSVNVMTAQRADLGLANYPLFTHREIEKAVKRWQPLVPRQRFSIEGERLGRHDKELSFEFFDAGHILGSVGTLIEADGRKIFYTGDVNFEDQNIEVAADFPDGPLDVLIIETTRGDRATPEGFTRQKESLRFANAINTAFKRGGSVLIPVFALGKTQETLAMLHGFRKSGLLGMAPIYIGGLSTKLTEIYDKLARSTARQKPELQILDDVAPFVLNSESGEPSIGSGRIFALSSGMMTDKTLSNNFARRFISQPQHSVFFVGFADPNSPGGKLKAAAQGEAVALDPNFPRQRLECHVESFNFSGHASRETLLAYIKRTQPKKVILVHGEPPSQLWFKETLAAELPSSEVLMPEPGVPVEV
jgi:Cft2 family RNA processing exonuclease